MFKEVFELVKTILKLGINVKLSREVRVEVKDFLWRDDSHVVLINGVPKCCLLEIEG